MEKQDPQAFIHRAQQYEKGKGGFEQSGLKSLECQIKAAELGSADAFCGVALTCLRLDPKASLGLLQGLLEISAKKGCLLARDYLGKLESMAGNFDAATKHWKVAAQAGSQKSLDELMKVYQHGLMGKEELAAVLRSFQASNDAMKSKARDEFLRAKAE